MPEYWAGLSHFASGRAFQFIGDQAMKKWRIAGINFDHMHMGDNLRMAFEHPNVEIVGICDEEPERMQSATKNFNISNERVFTDYRACIDKTKPDIVILCPATAQHADWVERVSIYEV